MKKHIHYQNTRTTTWIALGMLLIIMPIIGVTLLKPKGIKAEWWNSSWMYRQKIPVTNNTSQENNVYISVTINTSDTTKFQTDCGDLRFTKVNGQILPYYIVSGCGGASTVVHVQFDALPAGIQTLYYYYGNPSVANGTMSADFTTVASNYTVGSIGSQEITPGPVAWWKFDEGSDNTCSGGTNDACDSSTNGVDGAMSATAPSWQSEDQCVYGKCLYFGGNNDRSITVAHNTRLDFGTSSFTVQAWIRKGDTTSQDYILHTYIADAVDGGFGLNMQSDGTLRFGIDDDGASFPEDSATSTQAFDDNKWHFVVGVKNGTSNIKIYVDGREADTDSSLSAVNSISNDDPLYIGTYGNGTTQEWENGFIDDVKVYPYARSASEILGDYNSGSAALGSVKRNEYLSDGLVGYWKMDETSGTTVSDYSGNGNTGTLTNGQETGASDASGNSTTTLIDTDGTLSSTDDAYTGMILNFTAACGSITSGTQRIISDYNGTTKTFTVLDLAQAPDSCAYSVLHQIGGKYGNGIQYNGDYEYVSIPHASSIDITNQYTISSWINLNSSYANDENTFIDKGNGDPATSVGWRVLVGTGGLLQFQIEENGVYKDDLAVQYSYINTWKFVTVTHDGTTTNMYIDGVLVDKSTQSYYTLPGNTNTLSLGSSYYFQTNNQFNGKMDEVRIYNRALSASEVSNLYTWSPGSIAHWKLDENTGTSAKDSSGNGYTATLNNGPSWNIGKYGGGISFDGVDDNVSFADDANIVKPFQHTVEAWVKTTESSGDHIIVLKYNTDYELYIHNGVPNGRIVPNTYPTNLSVDPAGTTNIADGKWHHVAQTWNNGTLILYVDGKQENSGTSPDPQIRVSAASPIQFGSYVYGSCPDNCNLSQHSVDEVQIYNYARTPSQIVEDMNAGHPVPGSPVSSKLAWYKFDEQQGQSCNNAGTGTSSINGILGATTGTSTDDPTWKTAGSGNCKDNGCLSFDGGDFVGITDGSTFSLDAFTVSGWFYRTGGTGLQAFLIDNWNGTDTGWLLQMVSNHAVRLVANGQASGGSTSTLALNTWVHVAATLDATTIKMYINGKLESTTTRTAGTISESNNTRIGMSNSGSNPFYGSMDDIKMYPFALTDDQVKLDYNAGSSMAIGSVQGSSEASLLSDGAGNPPVGEWKLDENSGINAFDTSGNNYTGTLTSGPSWVVGKIGSAVQFDGSNDYIDVSDSNNLETSGAKTVEFWAYPTNINVMKIPISKYRNDTAEDGWIIYFNNSGNITAAIKNDASTLISTSNFAYSANTWYHVAVTWDTNGGTIKLYVNGRYIGQSSAISGSFSGNARNLSIGRDINSGNNTDSPFSGILDHFQMFNYERTQSQIAYDYNRGAPVGWWKMDECEGTTAHDASGNANNGTIAFGSSGNTAVGTCTSGTNTDMWNNGASGKFNASIDLDGTDDSVSIGDIASYEFANGQDFALSLWVKSPVASTRTVLAKKAATTSTNSGYMINIGVNGEVIFYAADGTDQYELTSSNGVVQANTWTHVTIVYDDDSTTNTGIYVNGKLLTTTATGTLSSVDDVGVNTRAVMIGAESDDQAYYDGLVDDVRIYNYALSPTQIQTVMNNNSALLWGP